MASTNSAISRPTDDDRGRKHHFKKLKNLPHEGADLPATSANLIPLKSDKSETAKPSFCDGNNDGNSRSKAGSTMTSFPASVGSDCGDNELCSPPQGRRPSQPLLTIAEEEEVAVDPVRRGSQLESRDEDDDKSVGDTMDTFDDIRRRRCSQRMNDDNEDDDDEDDDDDDEAGLSLTLTDQQDSKSGAGSLENVADGGESEEEETKLEDGEDDGKQQTKETRRQTKQSDTSPQAFEQGHGKAERPQRSTTEHQADDRPTAGAKSSAQSSGGAAAGHSSGKATSPRDREDTHRRDRQKPAAAPRTTIDISDDRKAVWFSAVTRGDLASIEKLIEGRPEIVHIIDDVSRVPMSN